MKLLEALARLQVAGAGTLIGSDAADLRFNLQRTRGRAWKAVADWEVEPPVRRAPRKQPVVAEVAIAPPPAPVLSDTGAELCPSCATPVFILREPRSDEWLWFCQTCDVGPKL